MFDSFAKIKSLTQGQKGDPKNLADYYTKALPKFLEKSRIQGIVQFKIGIEKPTYFHLILDGNTCEGITGEHEKPNLELIIKPTAAVEIAEGKISPIEASAKKQMRIRGDTDLGLKLYKHLAASKGRIAPCSWSEGK